MQILRVGPWLCLGLACGGSVPDATGPLPVATGTIAVTVNVTGNAADSNWFAVSAGTATKPLQPGTSTTFAAIAPGAHQIALTDISANCFTSRDTATVSVVAGAVASLAFAVRCYGGFAYTVKGPTGPKWIEYVDPSGRVITLIRDAGNSEFEDWAPSGAWLVYTRDGELWRVASDGSQRVRLTTGFTDTHARISPDGTRIIFQRYPRPDQVTGFPIMMMNADGSNLRQVVPGWIGPDFSPSWSPDGTRIAFGVARFGGLQAAVMNSDGTGVRNYALSASTASMRYIWWSPDGTRLLVEVSHQPTNFTIVDIATGSLSIPWSAPVTGGAHWSPNGQRIVAADFQLMLFDPTGGSRLRIPVPAMDPMFSRDGSLVLYGSLTAIAVAAADGSFSQVLTPPSSQLNVYREKPRWNPGAPLTR